MVTILSSGLFLLERPHLCLRFLLALLCTGGSLKLVGIFLLLFGGIIAVTAVALLRQPSEQTCFVLAGFTFEALGLTLLARDYALHPRNTR
jgi:hypothetical protein